MGPPRRDQPGGEVVSAGAGAHGTAHSATSSHCTLPSSTHFTLLPPFFPFLQAWGCAGSLRCSGGVQEQGGHWQRGVAGVRPHVLHPSALVSASHGSPAADRSYSEPRSMSEHRVLGDSHGRHIGRKAAGREEQAGFFRRFPNPFPPPQSDRFQ